MIGAYKECLQCGGTGQVILLRSWFIADGLRKERCGICGGAGKSDYIGDRAWAKRQALWRSTFPRHPDATPSPATPGA